MGNPETPKEAPKNAKDKMADFMPAGNEPEIERENQPIGPEELKKISKGYPEIKITGEHKEMIATAKKNIKETKKSGDVTLHGSSAEIVGKDGHEYVYLRDETQKPSDRLFKSEAPVVAMKNELVSAELSEYVPLKMKGKLKRIAKLVQKELKNDAGPMTYLMDLDELVTNRLLTQDDADNMEDGDTICAYKDTGKKGKITYFLGWKA